MTSRPDLVHPDWVFYPKGVWASVDAFSEQDAKRYSALRTLATMPANVQEMALDLMEATAPGPVLTEADFDARIDRLLQIVGL